MLVSSTSSPADYTVHDWYGYHSDHNNRSVGEDKEVCHCQSTDGFGRLACKNRQHATVLSSFFMQCPYTHVI